MRGPKVEELYSEMLRDMAHACKLNQQSQDQASPVNVPIDEFNCKELGLLDMTLNTNQTFKLNVSVEERLLESFSSDKDYEKVAAVAHLRTKFWRYLVVLTRTFKKNKEKFFAFLQK